MNIKNLVLVLTVLSVSACASKSVPDAEVNKDIVGNTQEVSSVVEPVKSQSKRRASPITEEEAVSLETTTSLSDKVFFAFDSDLITEEGKKSLDSVAELLLDESSILVVIEGHCDERGTKAYNLALGARRAESVKKYLVAKNVSEKRLSAVSYGEEKPASVGVTGADYAKNRRVEFKIK